MESNAMDCNELNNRLTKLCCPHIVLYITHILNFYLLNDGISTDWKKGSVKVIPKKQNPIKYEDLRESVFYQSIQNFRKISGEVTNRTFSTQSSPRRGYEQNNNYSSIWL